MLKENVYYHIYNQGIDGADIFFSDKDFKRFKEKYLFYLGLSVETLAYSLMSNHFHFLIKTLPMNNPIKNQQLEKFENRKYYIIPNPDKKHFKTEVLFGHLLNSYTKYINSKHARSGTIWDGNFKKREIDSEEYLQHCICYIHRNPIHHGLTTNYEVYPYSSYMEGLGLKKELVNSTEIIKIFGSGE